MVRSDRTGHDPAADRRPRRMISKGRRPGPRLDAEWRLIRAGPRWANTNRNGDEDPRQDREKCDARHFFLQVTAVERGCETNATPLRAIPEWVWTPSARSGRITGAPRRSRVLPLGWSPSTFGTPIAAGHRSRAMRDQRPSRHATRGRRRGGQLACWRVAARATASMCGLFFAFCFPVEWTTFERPCPLGERRRLRRRWPR